jgi:hypothetical protein
MKKIYFILVVSFFKLTLVSQISVTSVNMPVSGDTIRYSNAKLSSVGDFTTTGANYIWNFDTLRFTTQAIREFKSGLNTPYSILFGFSAYGEKTIDTIALPAIPVGGIPAINLTDVYTFYSKSSAKFIAEGLGIKINNIPVPNFFSDEDELYFFPLNYTDRDSSTFRFSTISNTLIPFQYIKQGHRITEADGWGSITTPYGTANCLRVVTTQYSIDTIKGNINLPIVGLTPFAFGFKNYQRSYQWLTLGEHIPYFEVSGNINNGTFNATQAKYRDVKISTVGIKDLEQELAISLFPNPVTNQLTILTPKNKSTITLQIVDLQGKEVLFQELAHNFETINQYKIDVSKLAKGLYNVNLNTALGKQTLKIVVQ